jgi:hypothetical protein
MNKLFLFLLMLPKGLWRSLGADVDQLKAILKVRLMMDDRRPITLGKQQSQKKPRNYMTVLSMIMSAAIGFFYSMSLMLHDTFMGLWLYFSMFVFMLSFLLITDFSNVLFDTRDKFILLPRPVNERTLLLSRLLHILIYMFRNVLPMSLAGWIIIGIDQGWLAALWFPIPVLLLTLIALFLVNGCYLLVLKFSKPGKFQDVINYFQIAFSIMFFACVYLLPKAFQSNGVIQMKHQDFAWAKFVPSYWLAATFSWIHADTALASTKWLSILAVVFPLLLIWITLKWLAPSFSRRIAGIDAVESVSHAKSSTPKKQASGKLYLRLATLLNKNTASRAGFSIVWLQTSRSRSFKMRVLPSFAYVPFYFFYLLTQNRRSLSEVWAGLQNSSKHLVLLYLCSFIVIQLLTMLVYSEQYKASWIYYSSPVQKPGDVMAGALKAVWAKYFFPMYFIVSCFVLSVWGPGAILDIILAFINISLFATCIMRISFRRLPFSAMEQMKEKGSRFFKSLFIMLLPACLGFGHYLTAVSLLLWWLKIIFIILSAILLWLVWDSYKNTSWLELKKTDL